MIMASPTCKNKVNALKSNDSIQLVLAASADSVGLDRSTGHAANHRAEHGENTTDTHTRPGFSYIYIYIPLTYSHTIANNQIKASKINSTQLTAVQMVKKLLVGYHQMRVHRLYISYKSRIQN